MRKRWERERREGVPRPHFPEFWTHGPPPGSHSTPSSKPSGPAPVTRGVTAQRRSPLLLNGNAELVGVPQPAGKLSPARRLPRQ